MGGPQPHVKLCVIACYGFFPATWAASSSVAPCASLVCMSCYGALQKLIGIRPISRRDRDANTSRNHNLMTLKIERSASMIASFFVNQPDVSPTGFAAWTERLQPPVKPCGIPVRVPAIGLPATRAAASIRPICPRT